MPDAIMAAKHDNDMGGHYGIRKASSRFEITAIHAILTFDTQLSAHIHDPSTAT